MNRYRKKLVAPCILIACMTYISVEATVTPFLAFRSQGFNGARELVGWQTQINKYGAQSWYGSFSITPECTKSFRSQHIAEWLLCDALTDLNNSTKQIACYRDRGLKIQGTKVDDRDNKALMAENFYLPPDFSSTIKFNPSIKNELVDFNVYVGLDPWLEGLFFRIHTPLVHTSWALHMQETVLASGTQNYDPGYFDNSYTPTFQDPLVHGMPRKNMLNNFTEYVCCGKSPENMGGIRYNGLTHARMNTHALSKTAFAELTTQFGWNFCLGPEYHFGLAIRAAAPTGTRPTGNWFFEPIVGNGHHWELGGSLTTHWCSWKNLSETSAINTYVDINITHLFSTRQYRTFDLWCNPLSRYMMAMRFTTSTNNLKVIKETPPLVYPPTAQFAQQFTPLANISTIPVDVSAAVQGELILKFAFSHCNYQVDLGYNFWGRTCLKIFRACCPRSDFDDYCWGMKGDSFTFGFPTVLEDGTVTDVQQPGIPLSATQSDATTFNGCNNYPTGLLINNEQQPWYINPGIDNPQLAYNNNELELSTKQIDPDNPGEPTFGWNQVNTSVNQVLLTFNDLDINRARTRSMSQKAFIHFNYLWQEHCLAPYLGIGAEIEFGQRDDFDYKLCKTCNKTKPCAPLLATCCVKDNQCFDESNCKTMSLSQWGIWIKGGVSF